MSVTLTIHDETVGAGPAEPVLTLDLLTSTLSAEDLIRRRVEEETRLRNAADAAGERSSLLSAEAQIEQALMAFRQRHLLLLVDNRQVESLQDEISIGVDTRVTFLRLVPLAGG